MDKLLEKMPDIAPDGPLNGQKGLLSPIGDTLGQGLDKGLKPLGKVTGAIGKPTGEALLGVEDQARKEVGYQGGYYDDEAKSENKTSGGEPVDSKPQTAENPLGL